MITKKLKSETTYYNRRIISNSKILKKCRSLKTFVSLFTFGCLLIEYSRHFTLCYFHEYNQLNNTISSNSSNIILSIPSIWIRIKSTNMIFIKSFDKKGRRSTLLYWLLVSISSFRPHPHPHPVIAIL